LHKGFEFSSGNKNLGLTSQRSAIMEKLFVYGTLAPNRPNEHILKAIDGSWKKGFVWGRLYKEGWGAEMGYPGIRLEDKFEKKEGFIFYSNDLNNHWAKIDAFEGDAYQRVKTKITLEGEEGEIEAFIYALR